MAGYKPIARVFLAGSLLTVSCEREYTDPINTTPDISRYALTQKDVEDSIPSKNIFDPDGRLVGKVRVYLDPKGMPRKIVTDNYKDNRLTRRNCVRYVSVEMGVVEEVAYQFGSGGGITSVSKRHLDKSYIKNFWANNKDTMD